MDPLTLNLISTTLAAMGVVTCGLGAILVLPWGEWSAPSPTPSRRVVRADLVPAAVAPLPATCAAHR